MADQASLNATFFAFRKRDRGVLLGATIAYAVIASVIGGIFLFLNWQAFIDYWNWTVSMGQTAEDSTDPSAVFASMMPPASVMALAPAYTLLMVLSYFLLAAYEAACLRWMIRGEVKGLFGLAIDGDTLRVYFTYWLWLFLFIAIYIVAFIVLLGFGVAVGVTMSVGDGPDAGAIGASMLFGLLLFCGLLLAAIYLGVRFAPAAATSIARRRFAFFEAWNVTKGRFWALFGSFVLLLLMYFVAIIILSIVAGVAMGLGLFGVMQQVAEPQSFEEVAAIFASPGVWVPAALCYGLMIVAAFMFYVALFGVNARAAQAALEEGKIQSAG